MTRGPKGLLYGGGLGQLGRQTVAVAVVGAHAFTVTYGIGKGIDRLTGLRASEEERTGLNLTPHAETAYDHGLLAHGTSHGPLLGRSAPPAVREAPPLQDRSPLG